MNQEEALLEMQETVLQLPTGNPDQMAKALFESQMGVTDSHMRRVLQAALSRGGDYADLYFEYAYRTSVVMEEGIIKNSSISISKGVGVRVLKGDQTGYAYSEDLSLEAMQRAARTAASIAASATVKEHEGYRFNKVKPSNHYPVVRTVTDLPLADKITKIQDAERAAHEYDPRIKRVTVSMVDTVDIVRIVTSDARFVSDVRPMFRMNVHCVAQEEKNVQTGSSGVGGRVGLPFLEAEDHPYQIGKKAAAEAILLLGAEQAPSGSMPVILGPAQSGILLHEAVGHPLEADFNRKGSSAYSGRIGEEVASPLCTIYDTGMIDHDRGALNCDDEGFLPSQNLLIENGILRGYMHDRISAAHYDLEPTGNGRRESYAHYPMPRMTTTYLANGKTDPKEILEAVDHGIYCVSFSGGQVDISNGDFVFVPTVAYLVENGKLTKPIKNLTLIGNGPDAMSRVSLVGNDFAFSEGIWTCGKDGQSVPVGVGLPTVLVSEMTVGGM